MNLPIDPRRKEEREKTLRGLETQNDSSILWNILRRNRTDMSAQLEENEYLPLDLSELKVLAQSIEIEAWLSIRYDEEKLQKAAKDTQRILLSQRELPIKIGLWEEILPEHRKLIRFLKIHYRNDNDCRSLQRTLKEWESLIEKLPNLQYIYLDYLYSSNTDRMNSSLSWSERLGLTIRGVKVGAGDHESLDDYDVSQIYHLRTSSSKLSSDTLRKLLDAHQLKTLDLHINTDVNEDLIDSLIQLPLQILCLGYHTSLNDDLCQKLSKNRILTSLYFDTHYISPKGVESLLSLPSLKSLNLPYASGYQFSEQEIYRLQQIRPDVDLHITNS